MRVERHGFIAHQIIPIGIRGEQNELLASLFALPVIEAQVLRLGILEHADHLFLGEQPPEVTVLDLLVRGPGRGLIAVTSRDLRGLVDGDGVFFRLRSGHRELGVRVWYQQPVATRPPRGGTR